MTLFERVAECVLLDDFAARDIDEHTARLHQAKAAVVEETVRLRCPLAADHDEIAGRQVAVEILGPTEFAEPRWQRLAGFRVATRSDDPHAECRTEPADLEADTAGADDAGGLSFDQKRPVGAVVEGS